MPIKIHIDQERQCVYAPIEGDFSLDDIFRSIDTAAQDPGLRPGFSVLSDHRAIGEPLTPAQARAMVDHLEKLKHTMEGVRWAIVTAKPASYGMLRMVAAMAGRVPMEIMVFTSYSEAEAWLFPS